MPLHASATRTPLLASSGRVARSWLCFLRRRQQICPELYPDASGRSCQARAFVEDLEAGVETEPVCDRSRPGACSVQAAVSVGGPPQPSSTVTVECSQHHDGRITWSVSPDRDTSNKISAVRSKGAPESRRRFSTGWKEA